ncbi:ABC transporter ATP-binding protein [Pseudomonas brassicacearum]|uniref:nickel ABC transporter ATP-binding protein NikE n=1 Tax=Pseudomonas brassicacearum TaxID=930166 RepID=UPI000F46AF7F|nr:ABC transporter ATP-binding protein [Pseudomonas brassicacearum]ROM72872.1 ABC transporter ATP-binding protein [Pseudomonas brassicacearum]
MSTVLQVADYSLDYQLPGGALHVLQNIDFSVAAGEVVGLVGESGSGKTTLGWAIMRYLAGNAREISGSISLQGENLLQMPQRQVEQLRGGRLGMIFQDPSASLNPTLSLGEQVVEVLTRHRDLGYREAWALGEQLLADVDLKDPGAMMKRFPHEASGGEKQRVLIATAFACRPQCLIFDEPTTALDVISSAQILQLFRRLREETGVASLYISHDLALVSRVADRVCVLNQGRIVEQARGGRIFSAPNDAYTQRLVASVPSADKRLLDESSASSEPLLSVSDLNVRYGRPGILDSLLRRKSVSSMGARDMNLSIARGEILGIIGESGSGKSTLAKALTGLTPFTGVVHFDSVPIHGPAQMNRDYRRKVQIIFQHPDASLNPRQTIGQILSRPLRLYGLPEGESEAQAIARLLREVRLPEGFASRYPHELSGGQKQRVAIARAFAARPELVICDEITAALDVSVQATVIELLLELRRQHGTAYLFITHDLNLIRQVAHRIAVMYRGDLLEILPAVNMVAHASHPYTRALLDAVPQPLNELESLDDA